LNERANSNAWIQPHTHDNQWTAWDANLGCKDVAYTLSLVAQEAYAKNGSVGTFERRKYVANEVRKNCLASIVNVPKNKNLPTQSETKFVRSKKPARACNVARRPLNLAHLDLAYLNDSSTLPSYPLPCFFPPFLTPLLL
jgi:hypothetical protein